MSEARPYLGVKDEEVLASMYRGEASRILETAGDFVAGVSIQRTESPEIKYYTKSHNHDLNHLGDIFRNLEGRSCKEQGSRGYFVCSQEQADGFRNKIEI